MILKIYTEFFIELLSENELKKITKGVGDKEFFDIVNKYAQPYVRGTPFEKQE